MITEPGVYTMTADEYYADPVEGGSLSSTGARKLLPPGCPRLFQYERENPKTPTREFNLGHAAHKEVLGAGADLVYIDAANYRTNKAQEDRDAAWAAGKIPVLPKERVQVDDMVAALRADATAAALLDLALGKAEQVLVWQDPDTGIMCRAMLDFLRPGGGGRRAGIVDYKTTNANDRAAMRRHVASYGYYQQDAWYRDGVSTLGIEPHPWFVFVFQETTPPYLVAYAQLDGPAQETGRRRNRLAREIYRDCTAAGVWPARPNRIEVLDLPGWVRFEAESEMNE